MRTILIVMAMTMWLTLLAPIAPFSTGCLAWDYSGDMLAGVTVNERAQWRSTYRGGGCYVGPPAMSGCPVRFGPPMGIRRVPGFPGPRLGSPPVFFRGQCP